MNERARPEAVAEPVLLTSVEGGIARLTMNRPRQYNAQEGVWMGPERKRGKLNEFNKLLCGLFVLFLLKQTAP